MFEFSDTEEKKVIETFFKKGEPLVLKDMPTKQKKKYIVLSIIAKQFEESKTYTEKEVNAVLEPIYHDYVMLRRYLVDFKFLSRENDGSSYWLNK